MDSDAAGTGKKGGLGLKLGLGLGLVLLVGLGLGARRWLELRRILDGPAAYRWTVFELTAPRVSGAQNAPPRDPAKGFLGEVVEVSGRMRSGPGQGPTFYLDARQETELERDQGRIRTSIWVRTEVPRAEWPADEAEVTLRGIGESDVKGGYYLRDAVFVAR